MDREQVWYWMNTPKTRYGFGATGDDSSGIDWAAFLRELPTNAANAWKAYTTAELQSQLLQLNITRAGQGLPMVKMPGISLGADTTTLLVVGGIGLALAFAVMNHGKRR